MARTSLKPTQQVSEVDASVEFEYLVEHLQASLGILESLLPEYEQLREQATTAVASFQTLEDRIGTNEPHSSASRRLTELFNDVERRAEYCRTLVERMQERLKESKLEDESRERVQAVRGLTKDLMRSDAALIDRDDAQVLSKFCNRVEDDVQVFRRDTKKLIDRIEQCQGKLDSFEDAYGKHQAWLIERRTEKKTTDRQLGEADEADEFDELDRLLSEWQKHLRDLQRTTDKSSPTDIQIRLTYFDDKAADADDLGEIEPTEEYLQLLPDLLDQHFASTPILSRVILEVQGNVLGEFGHPHTRTIQKFVVIEPQWELLRSGAYKDDWERLLSKCAPSPEFPRLQPDAPEGSSVMMYIVFFLFCLTLLLIVGMQVLGRPRVYKRRVTL